MIYVPRQHVIPKPEIPRTTELYLNDHISMSVLIVPTGLKKISYHKKYSSDPSLGSFPFGPYETRHVSETENIL